MGKRSKRRKRRWRLLMQRFANALSTIPPGLREVIDGMQTTTVLNWDESPGPRSFKTFSFEPRVTASIPNQEEPWGIGCVEHVTSKAIPSFVYRKGAIIMDSYKVTHRFKLKGSRQCLGF